MPIKIDTFLIGAQKAGTTWLYDQLQQHRHLDLGRTKENHFFVEDRFYTKGDDYLKTYYEDDDRQKVLSYVHMLSSEVAAERAFEYNPQARVLVVVRNPVDRAWSAYHFACYNGWESLDYKEAFKSDVQSKRLQSADPKDRELCYLNSGLYGTQVERWLAKFGAKQTKLLVSESMFDEPRSALDDVCSFLNIPALEQISERAVNTSSTSKLPVLQKGLRSKSKGIQVLGKIFSSNQRLWIRKNFVNPILGWNRKAVENPTIPIDLHETLVKYYAEDIDRLSAFLDRDMKKFWFERG